MDRHDLWHAAARTGMLLGTALLGGCSMLGGGPQTLKGESGSFNGATVSTWARMGPDGQVSTLGFTLPMSAVNHEPMAGHHQSVTLNFPKVAQDSTFINFLALDFMPQGHDPLGRYGTPHFDVHYHHLTKAQVQAIDCKDATQGDPSKVPAGWLPPVPPGVPPQDVCVPTMGYHALPLTEFKAPGEMKDGVFDQVMIAGYYGGKFIFVEPMVSRAALQRQASFSLPVPAGPAQATLYPTTFEATYNASTQAYDFVLGGFKPVQ
ncbi:hypothetical protein GCM10010840_01670 [Deinococcus aerolatus]|uniref:DUF5602 domain-containing protein n=1 Tax=Deinococcus aerolatus TaxID=522487 RepID=A0ABQ2FZ55_9DEIO|nr:cytochrome C [Deinococcus aerolatus]GGL67361.1 hypothetical protein GCM10010840_01670 [Deinococcus aerolatus]